MARLPLASFCQARSGDKADVANVAVFAPTEETYALLQDQLTAERVRAHLAPLVRGDVVRYEVPNLRALNFVCQRAIGGGGPRTLYSDTLAKTYAPNVLRIEIEVPHQLVAELTLLQPP